MRARISFFVGFIVAGGAFVSPAVSEDAQSSSLIYSPWIKLCLGSDICFVDKEARTAPDCVPRFGATLIERTGEAKKTLRVTVPASVDQARGVRVGIDQEQPIERPYGSCYANLCSADIDGGLQLIARLKQGRTLVFDAVGPNGTLHFERGLADFAAAYDGPPQEPKAFKSQIEKEQDEGKVWCDAN